MKTRSDSRVELTQSSVSLVYLRNILQLHAFEPRVKNHAGLVVRRVHRSATAHSDAFVLSSRWFNLLHSLIYDARRWRPSLSIVVSVVVVVVGEKQVLH